MRWRAGLSGLVMGVTVLMLASVATIIDSPPASAATISQGPPTSGTIDVVGSATYTDTLTAPGFTGVTFVTATTGFTVANNDELESTATLAASATPYVITGTDSDGVDTPGTWSYSLTVTADTIAQGSPTSGTTGVAGSANFNATLVPSSGFVGPVTFTTATTGFTIASNDELESTGTLAASSTPYVVTGTDSDAYGDSGTWSYSLTVTADTIAQGSPTSGTVTSANSTTFSSTLTATSGFLGSVTFATSTTGFTIVNGDELETTGALTSSGTPYSITGTDSDSYGDGGTWAYSLTVLPSGSKTTIVQTSATAGTVSNATSSSFTAGPFAVENNTGPVTFVTTQSVSGLTVSSSGLISTTGPLTIGTYEVSGTDSDVHGDSGTWTFTLTVTGAVFEVTFSANGGSGSMPPESESESTALTLNAFTRPNYTFIDWNTEANGSGASYANGAVYPFSAPATLFAQWRMGKVPSHTITFSPNGGVGTTPPEVNNTPTAISESDFTRAGYSFVDWNTAANGSGRSFNAGATYQFTKSIVLYAQWKKAPPPPAFTVSFAANGGSGKMLAERHRHPSPLTPNHFTRFGFTFVDWNTAANGSGASYANGATYSFVSSTTLFAQWKKNKSVAPPPIQRTALTIGPFERGSSTLSPGLEALIHSLAEIVKTKRDTQIALLGYGDELTVANSQNASLGRANVELGQKRAQAVATYLQERLNALGLKGWTISLAAAKGTTSSNGHSASGFVIVSLS